MVGTLHSSHVPLLCGLFCGRYMAPAASGLHSKTLFSLLITTALSDSALETDSMAWALTSFMRSKSSLAGGRLPLASAILTVLEAPCPRAFGGFLLQRVSQRIQKWWCMKKYQVGFWHGHWPSPYCNPLPIGCENHMVFRNKLLAKAQIPWTKMVIRGLNEDGRCQMVIRELLQLCPMCWRLCSICL